MKLKRGRPKNNQSYKFSGNNLDLKKETRQSLMALLMAVLALLTILSLFNISGSLGQLAVKSLRYTFGWGAFLLPLMFILTAISLYKDIKNSDKKEVSSSSKHVYFGIGLLTLVIITFFQIVADQNSSTQFATGKEGIGGGVVGASFGYLLIKTIGPWASFVLLIGGIFSSIIIAFNWSIYEIVNKFKKDKIDEKLAEPLGQKNLKINSLNKDGFNLEQVSNANPVSALLRKSTEIKTPNFLGKSSQNQNSSQMDGIIKNSSNSNKNWKFPSINFLEESKNDIDSGNIEANVAVIQKTLSDFEIEVEMGEVNVGPTVTQYTLRPTEGVRLSAILTLQNDLKLALAASSIRIEAPIPGKSLVGIEIPNKSTATVRLRELMSMSEFQNHKSSLAFVLGRDVTGKGIIEDLDKMPHLLIAGATGSGKSVGLNVILTSLLYRNTPNEVKFIIIDPKKVEMTLYNDIPHLVTPIITDYQKAVNALKWTVAEMDRRYNLLSEAKKRNIGEYNEVAIDKMNYLVVIVDELADLMTVAKNDVESTIVRLAQMSRAVGIHLVLATQRPSVDIITGLIKANITSRMAFSVASQVDSRTILDQAGAEKLLGKGDMLYVTSEMSQPKRIQGSLISEKEVKLVTDFLKKESTPSYDDSVTERIKVGMNDIGLGGMSDIDEPLLNEAKVIIADAGKASASLLQRRLRIGYARSARILDLLEEQGLVGPADGSKPRDVYVQSENFEMANSDSFSNNDEYKDF